MSRGDGLARRALLGSIWTTGGTLISLALQTGQLFILARLLSPADFGVAAIATFAILLGQNFLDLGIGNSLVVAPDLRPTRLHTAFWINLWGGLLVAGIVLASAYPVSRFYGFRLLLPMLLLNGAALAVQAPSVHYKSLLQRAQRFRVLSGAEVATASVAAVVNVGLVWLGVGVVAFAWSMLIKSVLLTSLLIYKGRDLYTPKRVYDRKEARGLLASGGYLMSNAALSTLANSTDTLILGKLVSATALGLLDLAKNLVMRPLLLVGPTLLRVGVPTLATIRQDGDRLRGAYLQTVELSLLLGIPIYVVLGVMAPAVVRVLFGEGWEGAIPLLRILAVMGLLRTLAGPMNTLLLALDRPRSILWVNGISALLGIACVVLGGILFGATGVALGLLAQVVLVWGLQVFFFLPHFIGLRVRSYVAGLPPFVLVILLTTLIAGILMRYLPGVYWQFWLGGPVVLVVYLLLAWWRLPAAQRAFHTLQTRT